MKKILTGLKQKLFKKKSLYEQVGCKRGIDILVTNFYQIMQSDPKAQDCLRVHSLIDNQIPKDVHDKLQMFLSGWLGGPNLFVEKIGAPRMRMRHMHVKIGIKEAEQWLYCMGEAIEKHPIRLSTKFKISFMNSCTALAQRIINS